MATKTGGEKPAKPAAKKSAATAATVTRLQKKIDSLEETLREQQHKTACESLKDLCASGTTLSHGKVTSMLKELGIDLNKKEVRNQIVCDVCSLTQKKHAVVPLKDVAYSDDGILISVDGDKVEIPTELLPFQPNSIMESVKSIFIGDLEAFLDKKFHFSLGSASNPIKIEGEYILRKPIQVDAASLQAFEKIAELRREKGVESARIVVTGVFGVCNTGEIRGRKEIPAKFLFRKKYPRKCPEILIDMAESCYGSDKDLWFKVGDILVWEEPKYSKATYIFDWPDEPLQIFIFKVWLSSLQDVRSGLEFGYVNRVNHVPNVDDWEKNLLDKMKKAGPEISLGQFTVH